jgi:ficolin
MISGAATALHVDWQGGWWYYNCHISNLNGLYLKAGARSQTGTNWQNWKNNAMSMKTTEMKIRPAQF